MALNRPVAALLIFACLAALFWPVIDYDSWSYHLPFSARLWGIGSGFSFDPVMERRWEGFPLAWQWLQGLLWAATGDVRATAIPQLGLLLAYFWLLGRIADVPRTFLILGFFSSPLLLLHQQSILNDLPAGLCLAMAFFLLLREDRPSLVAGALLLGLAGNIKIQALLGVYVVAAALFAVRPRSWLWLGIAVLLASSTAMWNTARTGNPVYPFEVRAGPLLIPGPENAMLDANPPRYDIGGRSIAPPQPLAFILSATELDWTIRGVAPRYSISMETGNAQRKGGPSRTGGWGWLFVLVNGSLLLLQLFRKREGTVVAAAIAVALVAFLPRSHELRYWLFLPLILLPLNIRFVAREAPRLLSALWIMTGYAALTVLLSPNARVFLLRPPVNQAVPPEIRDGYCGKSRDELLFRYSEAITGEKRRLAQAC